MLVHPQFDPVAVQFGPLAIHWYGLMYLAGFMAFLWLGRKRIAMLNRAQVSTQEAGRAGKKARSNAAADLFPVNSKLLDDLLFYGVLGVIIGGRLGEVLFYSPGYYFSHPLKIIAVWEGGMSFHGGFLGVLAAMAWIARKQHLRWLQLTDFIAPLVPPGLAFGRLGNFINGELWGRPSDVPWAMVFPRVDNLPRHPSQLYEFALEGVLLFALLWLYARKPRPVGAVSGLFLIGYGSFRFLGEFTRNPDDGIFGLMTFGISMGQWLSLPMVVAGVLLMALGARRSA
ncbi:MAG: prolipoprotein diacylglyceryl transferase [Gallionellales bacterium RIFCSPLOWO2_12_FULL_59_22]|nr:MAG: prolipoprotein diacylglyceryl transferase [Gallionellales bacterium RIFCSPLOWO2_02_FULL_59_110]OGT13805.1 MAG: prolipoprotein diacylglyceryl transferase [Gallionellales bacterium RIFCSPLOWO2_12_FULL_59_22]